MVGRLDDAKIDTQRPLTGRAVAVVVNGWPRLSETFILHELIALEARGLQLRLYALQPPKDSKVHAAVHALHAPVAYLPKRPWRELRRLWRSWRVARRLPGYHEARSLWRRDFARQRSTKRLRQILQAMVLAAELPEDVGHIYAHFLHAPASVARYAAHMRGLSWSVSAHAVDIWTTPEWEKREKLADAAWSVTCTGAGKAHLCSLRAGPPTELVHHGVSLDGVAPPAPRSASSPVRLLTVGRAVPKKGFDDLLRALAALPADCDWQLTHIGTGPLLPALRQLCNELLLADRIHWSGAGNEDDVEKAYRNADLFVLASRVTADGDRDGIPNVLLEAMSHALPVVTTVAGAIPELVVDGTGVLVKPGDPAALAGALADLIADPARRAALGRAGCERVRAEFPAARGHDRIAALLTEALRERP